MTSMPLTLRTMFLGPMVFRSAPNERPEPFVWRLARAASPPARREGQGRVRHPRLRTAQDEADASPSGLAVGRRPALQLLVSQVLLRAGLHHRLDDLLVGLVPVAGELPLLAVPG